MSDGLKRILDKIAETPTSTMIDRYLALVSELPTESDKTSRVLDLGESLVQKAPLEALRVAGMVHDAEQANLRAYDILIAAFEKLGRLAKAGVLRLEREKLVAPSPLLSAGGSDPKVEPPTFSIQSAMTTVDSPASQTGNIDKLATGASEGTSINELAMSLAALGQTSEDQVPDQIDSSADNPDQNAPTITLDSAPITATPDNGAASITSPRGEPKSERATQVSQSSRTPAITRAPDTKEAKETKSRSSNLNKLQSLVDGFLRDKNAGRTGSVQKSSAPTRNPLAATKGDDFGPQTTTGTKVTQSSGYRAATSATAGTNQRSQQSGNTSVRLTPNEQIIDLDEQTAPTLAPIKPESSWEGSNLEELAREAQAAFGIRQEELAGLSESELAGRAATAHLTPQRQSSLAWSTETTPGEVVDISAFWDPLRAQMGGISWDLPLGQMQRDRDRLLEALELPKDNYQTVPATVMAAIRENFRQQVAATPDVALAQTWDVLQAIWGNNPDSGCIQLLHDLNLTRATRGFWGFYLDALLARGAARKVLVEAAAVIARERQLSWANTAWQRLPTAWKILGVRGFTWQDEDGVDALLRGLAQRPRQTMRSMLLG